MADPKKIEQKPDGKALDQWLHQQLHAAGGGMSGQQGEKTADNEDEFDKEALEGLEKFHSTTEIYQQTARINRMVQKKTGGDRHKPPLDWGQHFWVIVALFVVILLIILAFIVIRLLKG